MARVQSRTSACRPEGTPLGYTARKVEQDSWRPSGTATAMIARTSKATSTSSRFETGPARRGQVVVAHDLAEVAGDDRGGLGPAHQHAAEEAKPDEGAEDHQRGKEQGADGVHVVPWG